MHGAGADFAELQGSGQQRPWLPGDVQLLHGQVEAVCFIRQCLHVQAPRQAARHLGGGKFRHGLYRNPPDKLQPGFGRQQPGQRQQQRAKQQDEQL